MSEPAVRAYVEHVALRVRDIAWHIAYFREVLGMPMREVDGPPDRPRQYWTLGGLQFIATPDLQAEPSNDAGWLAHLGVMVTDLEAAIAQTLQWGGRPLPQGRNWLQLPDGLAVELIQAAPGSVEQALAVDPRAADRD
jgi:catechol 2,3-dioxygenase-like lactoylglutathione lyase family enzyme